MLKKIISLLLAFIMIFAIAIPTSALGADNDYSGHWAESTIQSWLDNGYVNGYSDGSFKPEGLVTRAEFVKMVNNLFDYTVTTEISFTDVDQRSWYYKEIQQALKAGYITGVSKTKFAPNENLTREQAAVIISKIIKLDGNSEGAEVFTDNNEISAWAKDFVGSAAMSQVIEGYDDKSFKPQNPITRAEAIVILSKSKAASADLIIDKAGTIVENRTVKNIHITKEVGNGEVTLKNVSVTGELLIEGGGQNSIEIEDSTVNKLTTNKADGIVRILVEGDTSVDLTSVKSGAILEQQKLTGHGFGMVTVEKNSTVSLAADNKVKWTSSNTAVASINTYGKVTAEKTGFAIIYVTSKDGNNTAVCDITVVEAESDSPIEDDSNQKTIKILTIGNSFSQDAVFWLYDIAHSAGVNVIIGNVYYSGCSFKTHWTNASNNYAAYTYYKWTSPTMTMKAKQTMKSCILDEEWDYITFQQSSVDSGLYTTFQPYLNNLVAYTKGLSTNPDVKYAFNMTWAYAADSTHEKYEIYNKDQITMYNAITNAYQQAIKDTGINIVIPCGTAIQNGRTNANLRAVGDELTFDGNHLNVEIGRYIAGLTFFETLIVKNENVGKDLFTDVSYIPETESRNAYLAYLAKVSVKNAVLNPFMITDGKDL